MCFCSCKRLFTFFNIVLLSASSCSKEQFNQPDSMPADHSALGLWKFSTHNVTQKSDPALPVCMYWFQAT